MAYCPITIQGVASSCDFSKGGIKKVLISEKYEDGMFEKVASGDTATIASGSTDVKWYEFNFKKGVCSMTSTLNVDQANGINYVSTELVLQFNKMDTNKRLNIAALSTGDFAAIVTDSNGKNWVLGFDEPCNATAGSAQTGQAKTDGNFYQITIGDESETYPYEILAANMPTPETPNA